MNTPTKINHSQPDEILTYLNPCSKDFNFELWAKEVRQQMLIVLQQRLSSYQGKTDRPSRHQKAN